MDNVNVSVDIPMANINVSVDVSSSSSVGHGDVPSSVGHGDVSSSVGHGDVPPSVGHGDVPPSVGHGDVPSSVVVQESSFVRLNRIVDGSVMVVATVIATLTYQIAVNPPGGIWQDASAGHKVGFSVLATRDEEIYNTFLIFSITGYLACIGTVLLLISGVPIKRKFLMRIIMFVMWIAVLSVSQTFFIAVSAISPFAKSQRILDVASSVWLFFVGFLVLILIFRSLVKILGYIRDIVHAVRDFIHIMSMI